MSNTETFYSLLEESKQDYPEAGTDHDFVSVAKDVGYHFNENSQSKHEVGKHLYALISKTLDANDLEDDKEINKVLNQIAIDHLSERVPISVYNVLSVIRDATRQIKMVSFGSKVKWVEAIRLANIYCGLNTYSHFSGHARERAIVNALNYLSKNDITASSVDGLIYIEEDQSNKLINRINSLIGSVGGKNVIDKVFENLRGKFNAEFNRFLIGRDSDITGMRLVEAQIPYGYLLALSMKSFFPKNKLNNLEPKIKEVFELSKAYLQILGIQQFSGYEYLTIDYRTNIIEIIAKYVRYDWFSGFPQYSFSDVEKLVSYVVAKFDESKVKEVMGWSLKEFESVMRAINFISGDTSITEFSLEEIYSNKEIQISKLVLENILIEISHVPGGLNAGLNSMEDLSSLNFFLKPLIRSKNKYFLISRPLMGIGFLESALAVLRRLKKQNHITINIDDELGGVLEDVLKSELTKCGVDCQSSQKYSITKQMRNELGIKAEEGECDIVIETEGVIYFVEAKKKVLTRKSYTGISSEVVQDLAKSFFAAQAQLGRHELVLRKYGKITFSSGKELHLNGRKVERTALTMLDYWSLQDEFFYKKMFQLMIGQKLVVSSEEDTSDNQKILNEINGYLNELAHHFKDPSFQLYQVNYNHNNIRWFSLFQFFLILKGIKSKAEFSKSINKTRHVTGGICNWYNDFIYATKNFPSNNGVVMVP